MGTITNEKGPNGFSRAMSCVNVAIVYWSLVVCMLHYTHAMPDKRLTVTASLDSNMTECVYLAPRLTCATCIIRALTNAKQCSMLSKGFSRSLFLKTSFKHALLNIP